MMARYDAKMERYPSMNFGSVAPVRGPAFGRGYGRADQGYGGFDPGYGGFNRGYDAMLQGGGYGVQYGHGDGQEQSRAGIYGPERYGLGPYHQRLRTRRRPDAELQEEVREALFYDSWVDAEAVQVAVEDGIVTLQGELPDYDEIRYATDDVWDVDGVLGVRSELRVRQEQ